jgi:hypothetical protein
MISVHNPGLQRMAVSICPDLKPVHSITGTNWEGIGVKSDVVAGEAEWEEVTDAAQLAWS